MEPQHYLTTRWRSGYFAVNQVSPRVTVALEEIRRPFEQSVEDRAQLFLTRLEGIGLVGTLYGKVYLSADRRRASFQHSLLITNENADEEDFAGLFWDIYGATPDRILYVLCNLLSTREHWEGAPLVRSLLFGEGDPTARAAGVSRASALVGAILDLWPEALRTLPDVGVAELDALAGRLGGASTDPRQAAVTEELTEELTSIRGLSEHSSTLPAQDGLTDPEAVGSTERLGAVGEVETILHPRDTDPPSSVPVEVTEPVVADPETSSVASSGRSGFSLRAKVALVGTFVVVTVGTALVLTLFASDTTASAPRPPSPTPLAAPTRAVGPRSADGSTAPVADPPPLETSPSLSLPPDSASVVAPEPVGPSSSVPLPTSAEPPPPPPSDDATAPCYGDADSDGYGAGVGSAAPRRDCRGLKRTLRPGDCDDKSAEAHPGAVETCDGVDNDCDGDRDEGSVCAPAELRWSDARLNDHSRFLTNSILFSVATQGDVCESVRLNWRFIHGPKGEERRTPLVLAVKDGSAGCVLPFRNEKGDLFFDAPPPGVGPCSDAGFDNEDWAGTLKGSWQCCARSVAPSGAPNAELVCKDVDGSPNLKVKM